MRRRREPSRSKGPDQASTRCFMLSSTFMKLMYASYGLSYGLKYLWTSPSAQYFVHM
jgi:hypothetical protein